MRRFTVETGIGVPLPRSGISGDLILPPMFLQRVTKRSYEDALFYTWRRDPGFVLNQSQYAGARMLVTGPDFGVGCTHEHAVWALRDYGFSVVISSLFADSFYRNAAKNGLLAATMAPLDVQRLCALLQGRPGRSLTVNLIERKAACAGEGFDLQVDDRTRWRLINGLDDMDITIQEEAMNGAQ